MKQSISLLTSWMHSSGSTTETRPCAGSCCRLPPSQRARWPLLRLNMSGVLGRWANRVVLRICRRHNRSVAHPGRLAGSAVDAVSRGLGYDEAARIVGNHFPEVKDKLLNTLQLQQQVDNAQGADVTLLAASIDQRTASLRPLPFGKAVDIRPSLQALKFAVPVAVAVAVVFWTRPAWVTEPATRIVQHRTEFIEPAPFTFRLTNEDLRVPAGDPLTVEVEVVGDELPSAVMVESPGSIPDGARPTPRVPIHIPLRSNVHAISIFGQRLAFRGTCGHAVCHAQLGRTPRPGHSSRIHRIARHRPTQPGRLDSA